MFKNVIAQFLCRCSRLENLMLDACACIDAIKILNLDGDELKREIGRHNELVSDYNHLKFWWMRKLPIL